jgi:hypothetical protein
VLLGVTAEDRDEAEKQTENRNKKIIKGFISRSFALVYYFTRKNLADFHIDIYLFFCQ